MCAHGRHERLLKTKKISKYPLPTTDKNTPFRPQKTPHTGMVHWVFTHQPQPPESVMGNYILHGLKQTNSLALATLFQWLN